MAVPFKIFSPVGMQRVRRTLDSHLIGADGPWIPFGTPDMTATLADFILRQGRELFLELTRTGQVITASTALAELLSSEVGQLEGVDIGRYLSAEDRQLVDLILTNLD